MSNSVSWNLHRFADQLAIPAPDDPIADCHGSDVTQRDLNGPSRNEHSIGVGQPTKTAVPPAAPIAAGLSRTVSVLAARPLVHDTSRLKLGHTWSTLRRNTSPAVRSDGAPPCRRSSERTKAGDELAIGEAWRSLAGNTTLASMVCVALSKLALEAFMDGPRTQDQDVVARLHMVCDLRHKSVQVLKAVRLAGGLRDATAAMPKGGIVPDVAGCPVVRRHL